MTSEEFKHWLNGYLEDNPNPNPLRIKEMADKIDPIIPPLYPTYPTSQSLPPLKPWTDQGIRWTCDA